jgi:hypothetical protein
VCTLDRLIRKRRQVDERHQSGELPQSKCRRQGRRRRLYGR